jgi:ubiquinone/menaquinone biosynthesis C-methylase UbiE
MSSSYLLDPFVMTLLIEKDKSILDVGCGRGKWGYLIGASPKSPSYIVGGDLDRESTRYVKYHKVYDDVVLFDGRYLPFKNACFDIVLCFWVLHLMNKSEGLRLVSEVERVARERVSVSAKYSVGHHSSGWMVSSLWRRGYTVRGVGFGFFGRFVKNRLAFALASLAYYVPYMSYTLLAWKNLDKKRCKTKVSKSK